MINTTQVQKVTAAWISVVWTVCFLGVALFPGIRDSFMYYGLHSTTTLGESVISLTTFLSGLIIWNVIAWLLITLYAVLFNRIKA